jgi:hypothetical protein
MAIRSVGGGDAGVFLFHEFNIISTAHGTVDKGDAVALSTSGNWCVGTTAASKDILGWVESLSNDTKSCVVKLAKYNKVVHATYSAATSRGQFPVADTGNKIKGSGSVAASTRLAVVVAVNTGDTSADYLSI